MKNNRITQEQTDQMVALWKEGYGGRIIADKIGLKHSATVFKVLKRLGFTREWSDYITSKKENFWSFEKSKEGLRRAAEQYARFYFVLHGAIVHVPDSNAPYDLLVSCKEIGEHKKIQVKTSSSEAGYGGYHFSLIRTRSNSTSSKKTPYLKSECDYFFLMDIEGNVWLIPFEDVGARSIVPNLKYAHYRLSLQQTVRTELPVRNLDYSPVKAQCVNCGKELPTHKRKRAHRCSVKKPKATWPLDDDLAKIVWQKSLSSIARELGVSDNAVKKHCRVRKIPLPDLKYWIEQGNFGFQNRKLENSLTV